MQITGCGIVCEFVEVVPCQELVLFMGMVAWKRNLATPALRVLISAGAVAMQTAVMTHVLCFPSGSVFTSS